MSTKLRSTGSRFLENLAYLVPGSVGYRDRSRRKDEDSRLRSLLLHRLTEIRGTIVDLLARLAEGPPATWMDGIEERARNLDTLADAIRYAPYGFSGFFDAPSIAEETLDQILEVDLLLFEDLDHIEQTLLQHRSPLLRGGEPPGFLEMLDRRIMGLERHLIRRDKILGGT